MLIQKLRLQKGWSQEQVAELSGLSVRTIQRIERGQTASVETLKALGSVFDIDFSKLREPDMAIEASLNNQPVTLSGITPEEALAFAHVRKIKGFYMHAAQFGFVMVLLLVINLLTSPRYLWVGWVFLGWGSGLLFHGLRVFDKVPFLNGDWERRQVERFLGRRL